MPISPDKAALSAAARRLEAFLASIGKPISHSEAIRALAATQNERNEHVLLAKVKSGTKEYAVTDDEMPLEDPDFGPECVITTNRGVQLRCPSYPEDCSYVRVTLERDNTVQEVAYSNEEEWQREPAEVMGAIIGCLLMPEAEET